MERTIQIGEVHIHNETGNEGADWAFYNPQYDTIAKVALRDILEPLSLELARDSDGNKLTELLLPPEINEINDRYDEKIKKFSATNPSESKIWKEIFANASACSSEKMRAWKKLTPEQQLITVTYKDNSKKSLKPSELRWLYGSYMGLHLLHNGDQLTIFDRSDPERIVWNGLVGLKDNRSSEYAPYKSLPTNCDFELWESLFTPESPAQLIPRR